MAVKFGDCQTIVCVVSKVARGGPPRTTDHGASERDVTCYVTINSNYYDCLQPIIFIPDLFFKVLVLVVVVVVHLAAARGPRRRCSSPRLRLLLFGTRLHLARELHITLQSATDLRQQSRRPQRSRVVSVTVRSFLRGKALGDDFFGEKGPQKRHLGHGNDLILHFLRTREQFQQDCSKSLEA